MHILVVEDDDSVRAMIVEVLAFEGYQVDNAPSTSVAAQKLEQRTYPIVISDIYLDEKTGLDVLKNVKEKSPSSAVILMSGRGSMETVMAATRGGAFDYLAKPFESIDDLISVVKRAEASLKQADSDNEVDIDDLPETEMIGTSPKMISIYKTIAKAAPSDATILIEGETGTGKELIARMVHRMSGRSAQAFVPVDCGSIAPSLLESELFGAMKGAYTGAERDRTGVFESADKGTVFLDEIGDIDPGFQAKLLRFLQEREVRPLGASRARKVDVRVVAATNKNIPKLVEEGKFREDLWFRLNAVPIQVPPLAERLSDIPLLADYFTKKYNARYGTHTKLLESGVKALQVYSWPGNVRQLQHMIERLSILAPQNRIDEAAVKEAIEAMEARDGAVNASETLADTEADQIRRVMAACKNNKSRAAKVLGIERKTLYRKLERMGIG
jgi:DNA-binding NtrC family response regulator